MKKAQTKFELPPIAISRRRINQLLDAVAEDPDERDQHLWWINHPRWYQGNLWFVAEAGKNAGLEFEINDYRIRQAIALCWKRYPGVICNLINHEINGEDLAGGEEANIFLQLACFGKILYQ